MLKPWIVDANDINVSQDIQKFQSDLLHSDRKIRDFLSDECIKTIVVSPKGLGKTLLLKTKRIALQRSIQEILPTGSQIVDHFDIPPKELKKYGKTRNTKSYWIDLWLATFSIAMLKMPSQRNLVPLSISESSRNLIDSHLLEQPSSIFTHLISLPKTSWIAISNDLRETFIPLLQRVHSPLIIFVDNIDEFYDKIITDMAEGNSSNDFGAVKKEYWYLIQLGAAEAARILHRTSTHIKIFVAVRKEVLNASITRDDFGVQLRSSCLDLSYNDSDLKSIIEKNIEIEPKDNLVDQSSGDSAESFFGKKNVRLIHPTTGDSEHVFDFWIRHTLGRPRDVVAIGDKLSNEDRRKLTDLDIRRLVRSVSANLARDYLNELKLHVDGVFIDILARFIMRNVLTIVEMATISDQYQAALGHNGHHAGHIFCALFKVGLLGYVSRDIETGAQIQSFYRPGEMKFDELNILPDADVFLIHPMLDDVIGSLNTRYLENINRNNIIGRGRPWRDEEGISYILVSDLKGYSTVMGDTPKNTQLLKYYDAVIAEHCKNLDWAQRGNGDSVLLIAKNPILLLNAASIISGIMRKSEFQIDMRFGGDCGYLNYEDIGGQAEPVGLPLQAAARIEPHTQLGEIFVTQSFVDSAARSYGHSNVLKFTCLGAEDLPKLPHENGRFDLRKKETDRENWTALFKATIG